MQKIKQYTTAKPQRHIRFNRLNYLKEKGAWWGGDFRTKTWKVTLYCLWDVLENMWAWECHSLVTYRMPGLYHAWPISKSRQCTTAMVTNYSSHGNHSSRCQEGLTLCPTCNCTAFVIWSGIPISCRKISVVLYILKLHDEEALNILVTSTVGSVDLQPSHDGFLDMRLQYSFVITGMYQFMY